MPFPTTKLRNQPRIVPLHQGNTNGCGTTCLAMIFSYLLQTTIPPNKLDRQIRRMDIFTSPGDLLRLARRYDLNAAAYNRGTLQEVRSHLEKGRAIQAVIRSRRGGLHYVVLTGIEVGKISGDEIICLDPAIGEQISVTAREFLSSWGNLPGLFHNFYVVYAHHSDLLPESRIRELRFAIGVLDGITRCANNLDSLFFPDDDKPYPESILQVLSGLLQSLLLLPPALFRIALGRLKATPT